METSAETPNLYQKRTEVMAQFLANLTKPEAVSPDSTVEPPRDPAPKAA